GTMASAHIVFCLIYLFLGVIARFISAKSGDSVTLHCYYEQNVAAWFYWYKQTLGETPKLISTFFDVSDSATYYCISSGTIQPGGSVSLHCMVHTMLSCDGEHSVYWFKDSEDSQPGLIYTHGVRNDQCERKANKRTHTCVYNLRIESLNVSHAGIYYCAVASCGHILFGNGTKLDFGGKSLFYQSAALTLTTIISVLSTFLNFFSYFTVVV
uniref:Ig-like domain-containing protein n=1 Tax=Oreochromis aureus TaxID=47969 RepID=A0A668RL54_OREAU